MDNNNNNNQTFTNQNYNYNNSYPAYAPYQKRVVVEEPAVLDFREKMGRKLLPATLIYALFSTFCIYNNFSGVTMPFFGIATLIYMCYGLKQYDVKIKKFSWFYATIMIVLSISNFLTGNLTMLFFNNFGIILMLFVFLIHNVYDDSRWNFSKTAIAICESFFYSFGALEDFAKDMKVLKERSASDESSSQKKRTVRYVLIGLLISVPLVCILLLLLSAADAVFSNLMTNYLLFNFSFVDTFGILITFGFIFFAAYSLMRCFSKKPVSEDFVSHRNLEPVIAITVLSLVSVIYLVFSVIQIVYLFLGGGQLPDGYSYSDYAREGFFQLLAVSIINFLMVLFVNGHFKESRALKVLMTIISLCTYIMIASSFVRIMMYIEVALLTELRVWVLWGLTLLSLLFVAVIISIFKEKFPLFRYSIIVVSVLYAIISFAHIDYIIADYDITYMDTIDPEIAEQDYYYIQGLSTDAAPAIAKSEDDTLIDGYLSNCKYFYKNRSWRQFNLSAYNAELLSGDH